MSSFSPQNFLDLVQRLSLECGIPGSGPVTTVNQTGQTADLVNWTASAWMDLQTKHLDWSFMLVSPGLSFATIAGQAFYTPTQMGITAGLVNSYKKNTFRNYLTSAGPATEVFM